MSDDRPPAPLHPTPERWPNHRPEVGSATIARVGMLIMPIVMVVAGVVGPNPGPAVFGALWLPLSLWFVVVRPLLRKRRNIISPRRR